MFLECSLDSMSKQIKLRCCLFFRDLNHPIAEAVFFHWLNLAVLMILLLILSKILLLIFPISDLVGLISRQVGLLAKFGLWSLRVMNASLLAVLSTLSSIPSFVPKFYLLRHRGILSIHQPRPSQQST